MKAKQMIKMLEKVVKKHGNVTLIFDATNSTIDGYGQDMCFYKGKKILDCRDFSAGANKGDRGPGAIHLIIEIGC